MTEEPGETDGETRPDLVEWDAAGYDALPLPHLAWGEWVVDALELRGDETVLELGCGTGRDTLRLLDRLPHGRVVAVDGSVRMLEAAREKVGAARDRVTFLHADLREPLHLDGPIDAAASVATLHWIPDHRPVLTSIARALRPGGRIAVDAGGAGNIAAFLEALRSIGGDPADADWHFASDLETADLLRATGFVEVDARLVPDPAVLAPGAELEAYLATVMLPAHLRTMSPAKRAPFAHRVAEAVPEPVIDYVRLRFTARAAG